MALILTLRFEHPMSEYPTSVINTAIGNGPFIGDSDIQAALLARTNEIGQYHQQTTFTYTGKTLISEAEARASNPGCHQFQGHSAGVWRLEGMITDSTVGDGPGVMLIDATTAEIYCAWYTGAVIAPKPTPVPTSLPQSIGGPGSAYPNPPLPNPYPEPTK